MVKNAAGNDAVKTGQRLQIACVLVLGVFLLGLAVSACQSLHCCLHSDAGSPAHQCFATLLAKGQIDTASPAVALEAAPVLVLPAMRPSLPLCPVADYTLLPVRGPPAIPA